LGGGWKEGLPARLDDVLSNQISCKKVEPRSTNAKHCRLMMHIPRPQNCGLLRVGTARLKKRTSSLGAKPPSGCVKPTSDQKQNASVTCKRRFEVEYYTSFNRTHQSSEGPTCRKSSGETRSSTVSSAKRRLGTGMQKALERTVQ